MKIAIGIAAAIIIIALAYWWFIYKPAHPTLVEGASCISKIGTPGTVKNGICTPVIAQEVISTLPHR